MPTRDEAEPHCRSVTISAPLGLHARPAARFVRLAETFDATIEVRSRGMTVSGRSIMGLMMLAAGAGTEVTLTARGPEGARALEALADFLEHGLD